MDGWMDGWNAGWMDGQKRNLKESKGKWRASLVTQLVKNPSAMQETPVQFLDQDAPLEKA